MRSRLATNSMFVGFLLLLAGCSFTPGVVGSNVRASEERPVPVFSNVSLGGSGDVVITVGDEQRVIVESDDNLLSIISTEVEGDTLRIKTTGSYSTRIGVNVTITIPELNGVRVSGSGNVDVKNVASTNFTAAVSGSGNVVAKGTTDIVKVIVSGSGEACLENLVARQVTAKVSGSGEVRVHASQDLDATVSGSGDIQYRGSPRVKQIVSGSGDISPYRD